MTLDLNIWHSCLLVQGFEFIEIVMATVNSQDSYAVSSILSWSECSTNDGLSDWPHPLSISTNVHVYLVGCRHFQLGASYQVHFTINPDFLTVDIYM